MLSPRVKTFRLIQNIAAENNQTNYTKPLGQIIKEFKPYNLEPSLALYSKPRIYVSTN
jgi:hypothetical protein